MAIDTGKTACPAAGPAAPANPAPCTSPWRPRADRKVSPFASASAFQSEDNHGTNRMTPEERLEMWLAEERSALDALETGPGPGVAGPSQIAGRTGLEVMLAMMAGQIPYAEMAKSLTFCAVKMDEGFAAFVGTPKREYLNPMGTIHGGWMTSILDSALGCAVHSALPAGQIYTTAGNAIKYVKNLRLQVSRVRAEAWLTGIEGRVATARATLVGPDGTLYAEATTECRLFEVPAAPRAS